MDSLARRTAEAMGWKYCETEAWWYNKDGIRTLDYAFVGNLLTDQGWGLPIERRIVELIGPITIETRDNLTRITAPNMEPVIVQDEHHGLVARAKMLVAAWEDEVMSKKMDIGCPVSIGDGDDYVLCRVVEMRGTECDGAYPRRLIATPHGSTMDVGILGIKDVSNDAEAMANLMALEAYAIGAGVHPLYGVDIRTNDEGGE